MKCFTAPSPNRNTTITSSSTMQIPISTGQASLKKVVTAPVMVFSVLASPVVTSGAELIVQRSHFLAPGSRRLIGKAEAINRIASPPITDNMYRSATVLVTFVHLPMNKREQPEEHVAHKPQHD